MNFKQTNISDYRRQKLIACAMQLLEDQQEINTRYGGLHAFMLAHDLREHNDDETSGAFVANWHYPKGDRIDYASGAQYFYHCHREDMAMQEHGHFHCFVRKAGWPKSYRLPQIPQRDAYLNNPMSHVIAIGLNRYGQPLRMFTVNRWVSKECWFDAQRLSRLTKRMHFSIEKNPEWQLVDRYVANLIQLFYEQIMWLHERRDEAVAQLAQQYGDEDIYHHKEVEELSSLSISVEEQVRWLLTPTVGG